MKKWSKPQLLNLSYRYTEAGGQGGSPDSVIYLVDEQFFMVGTSGPELTDPGFDRVN